MSWVFRKNNSNPSVVGDLLWISLLWFSTTQNWAFPAPVHTRTENVKTPQDGATIYTDTFFERPN